MLVLCLLLVAEASEHLLFVLIIVYRKESIEFFCCLSRIITQKIIERVRKIDEK